MPVVCGGINRKNTWPCELLKSNTEFLGVHLHEAIILYTCIYIAYCHIIHWSLRKTKRKNMISNVMPTIIISLSFMKSRTRTVVS